MHPEREPMHSVYSDHVGSDINISDLIFLDS